MLRTAFSAQLLPGSQTTYCGNVWSIVNLFGRIDVLSELDGDNAHRLSNGLTLTPDAHSKFDMLSLWFEEVPVRAAQHRWLNPANLVFPTSDKGPGQHICG